MARYLEGQRKWDQTFHGSAAGINKRRRKFQTKTDNLVKRANEAGLLNADGSIIRERGLASVAQRSNVSRWGPLDLTQENPPPSAIAGRTDTVSDVSTCLCHSIHRNLKSDAVALLKVHLRSSKSGPRDSSAPVDVIGQLKAKAKGNDLNTPIQHSASEEQRRKQLLPIHGLNIWTGIMR